MTRGGGSFEELMAFNDEHVVRAVASSRTPIIVAIGHERDVCLAELVADVRASTPSNAAELLVKHRDEIALDISRLTSSLSQTVSDRIAKKQSNIISMTHSIGNRLRATSQNAEQLISRISNMSARLRDTISSSKNKIDGMKRILLALSPEQTLQRGYSITRSKSGSVIKNAQDVSINDELITTLAKGTVFSVVRSVK